MIEDVMLGGREGRGGRYQGSGRKTEEMKMGVGTAGRGSWGGEGRRGFGEGEALEIEFSTPFCFCRTILIYIVCFLKQNLVKTVITNYALNWKTNDLMKIAAFNSLIG